MWDFKGHITIWGQGGGFNSKGRGPHLLAEDQSPDNSVGPGQGHWALAFNLTPLVNIVLPRDDSTCLHTLRPTCPLDLEEQPPTHTHFRRNLSPKLRRKCLWSLQEEPNHDGVRDPGQCDHMEARDVELNTP